MIVVWFCESLTSSIKVTRSSSTNFDDDPGDRSRLFPGVEGAALHGLVQRSVGNADELRVHLSRVPSLIVLIDPHLPLDFSLQQVHVLLLALLPDPCQTNFVMLLIRSIHVFHQPSDDGVFEVFVLFGQVTLRNRSHLCRALEDIAANNEQS